MTAAHRQAQAAAFDTIGEHYDEVFPHKEGQLAAGEWLISQLSAGARVLDVGCGTGLPTAAQLTAAGLRVTGIDISPVMLELAARNVPDASFRRLDLTRIGSETGSGLTSEPGGCSRSAWWRPILTTSRSTSSAEPSGSAVTRATNLPRW